MRQMDGCLSFQRSKTFLANKKLVEDERLAGGKRQFVAIIIC